MTYIMINARPIRDRPGTPYILMIYLINATVIMTIRLSMN
ncbi:hypothetical protein GCM10010095_85190 [Streptomyces anthocyanicus]|nr:hypothetical protein GCM10010095_85190 [Streptomyces anthocyanicus]